MKRILVVDDDEIVHVIVGRALRKEYELAAAMNGPQALYFLEHNYCDLILLDYEMPGMNGAEVLKRLRGDPNTSDIPVMFLTGDNDRDHVIEVLSQKPEGYMLKPVKADELRERVRQILN